ncbi:hypothetical protein H0H87_003017 [Tephrocybe sp. NHM501043]|nr:hypothetical protein H0H87_003017 [Tephrocybe sp. NHM501043]
MLSPMGEEEELEPLSAYARWKLEEDERFYATFPEARYAAQQYNTISSAYLAGTGYYYDANGHIARSDEPEICYNDPSSSYATCNDITSIPEPPRVHHCDIDYEASDLARALDPTSRDHLTKSSGSSPGHYDVSGTSLTFWFTPLLISATQVAAPPPPSPVETTQAHIIIPSQQRLPSSEPPLMDSLGSPRASTSSSSSSTTHSVPQKYYYPSMPYLDPSFHYLNAYPNSYNFYSENASQPGWRLPSPQSIRLSPLPPSRRPIAKKPPLACLFCRGRKIACGPPDPGSSDRSCK